MARHNIPSWIEHTESSSEMQWVQPQGYKIHEDKSTLEELYQSGAITRIYDPYDQIVDDLYEYKHPDQLNNTEKRESFTADMQGDRFAYGRWFHFPWSGELVHYPEKDDHFNLRTSRNRHLVTSTEQQALRESSIVVAGQSVGSNVVESSVQAGIGSRYMLIDKDIIAPSNLNRIRATMGSVGLRKTTHVGRRISQIDPYIQQQHVTQYDHQTLELLKDFGPSIIVEEMDDLAMKYVARKDAQLLQVPLVMASDIGERAIIEVERYDTDPASTQAFHGRLPKEIEDKLRTGTPLTDEERKKSLVKVNGLRNISPRLISSALEIGKEVAGMPQLGTTATIGGALTAVAMQEILLGRTMKTGSHVANTRKLLHGQNPTSIKETLRIMRDFQSSK